MVDPKLFAVMKPEQAARAAVALVIYHALIQRPDAGLNSLTMDEAFRQADGFLQRVLGS